MKSTRTARAAVPAAALGALLTSGAGTASAATTWWYSGGPHGSAAATFREQGAQLKVCDVNTGGYRALVDVQTAAGAHVCRVPDSYNDTKCTTVSAADGHHLAERRSCRLRICVIKTGQRPSYCKTSAAFYNDH